MVHRHADPIAADKLDAMFAASQSEESNVIALAP